MQVLTKKIKMEKEKQLDEDLKKAELTNMNNKINLTSIRIIGLILLFSIFLQIILGAWVRLTGSGMSCPDWPLCYGMFFPTPGKIGYLEDINYTYFQIFLEWIHRANAAFILAPLGILAYATFYGDVTMLEKVEFYFEQLKNIPEVYLYLIFTKINL